MRDSVGNHVLAVSPSPSRSDFRAAAVSAYAGAAVSSVGVVFLVLLYVGLLAHVHVLPIFGPLNDLCALLLVGAMSFRRQLPLATASVLTIGAWVLIVGVWARRVIALRVSTALLIAAAVYFGYPFWAHRIARQLSAQGADANVAA